MCVLRWKWENGISQQSRWGGRTSSSQCGRRCCHSMIPSEDTLLSLTRTAVRRSWSAHIRPSCPWQADWHTHTTFRTTKICVKLHLSKIALNLLKFYRTMHLLIGKARLGLGIKQLNCNDQLHLNLNHLNKNVLPQEADVCLSLSATSDT